MRGPPWALALTLVVAILAGCTAAEQHDANGVPVRATTAVATSTPHLVIDVLKANLHTPKIRLSNTGASAITVFATQFKLIDRNNTVHELDWTTTANLGGLGFPYSTTLEPNENVQGILFFNVHADDGPFTLRYADIVGNRAEAPIVLPPPAASVPTPQHFFVGIWNNATSHLRAEITLGDIVCSKEIGSSSYAEHGCDFPVLVDGQPHPVAVLIDYDHQESRFRVNATSAESHFSFTAAGLSFQSGAAAPQPLIPLRAVVGDWINGTYLHAQLVSVAVVAHHSENSTGRAWNTTAATFQILYLNASSTPIGLRASVDWDQIDYKDYSDGRTEVSFLFEGDPPPEGVVKLQPRQLVQGGSAPTSPLDELEYVWALTYSA